MTQKLMKLKRKLLIMITGTRILLLKNATNKLAENLAARLKQANAATKADFDDFIDDFDDKLRILNKKVTSNKTKHV